jgi:hypothetical protein
VSAFKKAMQTLTTTVVKAEAAEPASDEFAALKRDGLVQLEQLLALHAEMARVAERDGTTRSHQGWFEQTVKRARAIFDVSE